MLEFFQPGKKALREKATKLQAELESTLQANMALEKKFHTNNAFFHSGIFHGDSHHLDITPQKALFYYNVAAPVATAIDLVNDEFKNLDLAVNTDGTITTDDEIIQFLQTPNDDMVLEDFLEVLGIFFLVTNEVYIVANGPVNQKPTELVLVSPGDVEVRKSRQDGFVEEISVQSSMGTQQGGFASRVVFKRNELQFRFFDDSQTHEIWQIKGFNSHLTGRGRSKLNSISDEIEQYIQMSVHNLKLLKNGMRPSGALTTKSEDGKLTDDQFTRLKEQLAQFYSGAENAGNVMILDGLEFTSLMVNARDMDFQNLKKNVTATIFNRYKVPLPLVTLEKMTLANMDSAKLNLYDNAVLPFAFRMFSELTAFLGPRFSMAEDAKLVPFLDNITALRLRNMETLKKRKELGVLTINEIREEIAQDPIPKGGDSVLIPRNLVPAESAPPEKVDETEKAVKTSREGFTKLMQGQKDIKGSRSYSDEQIAEMADREFQTVPQE